MTSMVSVKVFSNPRIRNSVQEVETLVRLTCHQNIVRFLGLFHFDDDPSSMRCGYVMEYMSNGCLSAVIHDRAIKYHDRQVYSWIKQASRGIAYLHGQQILHRDINPRNMLLGDTIDILKIADFGMARQNAVADRSLTFCVGTIKYMAPEVIEGRNGYNSAADVYSLGISVWEMFHRKRPFYEHSRLSEFYLCKEISNGIRPRIELDMEEEMEDLILDSFAINPAQRPTVKDYILLARKLEHIREDESRERPSNERSQASGSSSQRGSTSDRHANTQSASKQNRSSNDEPSKRNVGQMLMELRNDDDFRADVDRLLNTLRGTSLSDNEEEDHKNHRSNRLHGSNTRAREHSGSRSAYSRRHEKHHDYDDATDDDIEDESYNSDEDDDGYVPTQVNSHRWEWQETRAEQESTAAVCAKKQVEEMRRQGYQMDLESFENGRNFLRAIPKFEQTNGPMPEYAKRGIGEKMILRELERRWAAGISTCNVQVVPLQQSAADERQQDVLKREYNLQQYRAQQNAQAVQHVHQQLTPSQLPAGWELCQQPDGGIFFVDHNNQASSWTPPQHDMPQGWERRLCTDGRLFYIDHNTQSSQWEHPMLQ